MKIIIFCLIAITLISSTSFASSEAPSDKKQSASPQYKCKGTALCISGKLTKIVDGDTIYLKDYKIRLSLTNAPEKGEKGFKDATYFTKKLCPIGSIITVDQDDKQPYDKYKRVVGKVTCSGKVLNSELLYNNQASILKQYCSKSEFSSEPWAKKFGCTQTVQLKENKQPSSQPPTTVPPTPPKDSDYDGIPDSYDACPFDRESINGYQDTDGCPDTLPVTDPDSDGDSIPNSLDQCDYDKETYNGYLDWDGCPDEIPKESQTPTPPPTNENQCDPSYPDVCIPPYPPDLDCGEISYRNFKVLPPDPHGFDGDNDGIGCEK